MAESTLSKTHNAPSNRSAQAQEHKLAAYDKITNEQIYGVEQMPYKGVLSLRPLIRFWEAQLQSPDPARRFLASIIQDRIAKAPELLQPVKDDTVLEQQAELLGLLFTALFPQAEGPFSLGRVMRPLDVRSIYRTPAFDKMLRMDESYSFEVDRSSDQNRTAIIYGAACMILNTFYGQQLAQNFPFIVSVSLPNSGLQRHFKGTIIIDFMEPMHRGELPVLSQERIDELLTDPMNSEQWLEIFSPDQFWFRGVIAEHLDDITEEVSLSKIKNNLLETDIVITQEKMEMMQRGLQAFFTVPELRLGLLGLDMRRGKPLISKYHVSHPLLGEQLPELLRTSDSIYSQVLTQHRSIMVEDLTQVEDPSEIEATLLNSGIRSIIIVPLFNSKEQLIGIVEIGAPNAKTFNQLARIRLEEISPLFSLAIQRKREEVNNQIEAIIREQYTTLHPSVEWRFVNNAFEMLGQQKLRHQQVVAKPIVFEKVYPLYGQADIVHSSIIRNAAIQADLQQNISLLLKVIGESYRLLEFPILEQKCFKLQQLSDQLEENFTAVEETAAMELLHQEIHPFLEQIRHQNPQVDQLISDYQKQLDPVLGMYYQRRKEYEDSVAMLNDAVSAFIEQEDQKAQAMIPHYFEKYQTDGIEFEMYAGQALLQEETFEELHLQNLRLWQLMTLCGVTREIALLQKDMPIALETAQMIFVYNDPIDIRFRMDEKRFDVDGTYNVRYEIIKKRIDKAVVKSTNERIRAAGKITIVYTHEKSYREYLEYFHYLVKKGLLEPNIEELELEALQGVEGLKALRVKVKI